MTDIPIGYVVSCAVRHLDEHRMVVTPWFAPCQNEDEAVGRAMRAAREMFPVEDGYTSHEVAIKRLSLTPKFITDLYQKVQEQLL